MSQLQDKLKILKDAIHRLYCVEGKSLNYISSLFSLDRKAMSSVIKNEWKFEKKYVRQVTPRMQKLLNRCKPTLLSYMGSARTKQYTDVFDFLKIEYHQFASLCQIDPELDAARIVFRKKETQESLRRERRIQRAEESWGQEIPDEVWKDILGYEGIYKVSDRTRVMSVTQNRILVPRYNKVHGRYEFTLYNGVKPKCHKRYRLVAHAFVANPGKKRTVNHLDGDKTNDFPSNLEWASQGENNEHRNNVLGKGKHSSYCKNGRFTAVVIDDTYRFKTIVAASRFMGVSETQVQRYLSGETPCNRNIKLEY